MLSCAAFASCCIMMSSTLLEGLVNLLIVVILLLMVMLRLCVISIHISLLLIISISVCRIIIVFVVRGFLCLILHFLLPCSLLRVCLLLFLLMTRAMFVFLARFILLFSSSQERNWGFMSLGVGLGSGVICRKAQLVFGRVCV